MPIEHRYARLREFDAASQTISDISPSKRLFASYYDRLRILKGSLDRRSQKTETSPVRAGSAQ
jgi:hypothetical protein